MCAVKKYTYTYNNNNNIIFYLFYLSLYIFMDLFCQADGGYLQLLLRGQHGAAGAGRLDQLRHELQAGQGRRDYPFKSGSCSGESLILHTK